MNRETLALAERYDRLARELEDQTIARLDRAIDQSYRNLEREFLKAYPQMQAQGSLLASQRRAVLMNDLAGLLAIIRPEQAAEYEQLFQQMVVAASGLGGDLAGAMLKAIAPDSFARAFAGINLEAAALQARDGARRLYRYNEEFQGKASAIVEQGLIQGWGARRVADSLRSEMGIAKFNAERIARTEVMSALNDGAQLRYQQAGVEAVQWMATPSEGLCPICADRNMQVYPVGKVRVPAHPFCRCLLAPFSRDWQKLGLTDDEFAGEYRDRLLTELKQSGKQPNNGVSPFEKAAGLTRPPEPIWKPGDAPPTQPEPQQPQPAGIPVSRALKLSKGVQSLQSTIDLIDSIHGDGELLKIPVKIERSKKRLGGYAYQASHPAKPVEITVRMNEAADLTIAHEIGHFLDQQAIGKGRFASADYDPRLRRWEEAIENSKAVQSIRLMIDSGVQALKDENGNLFAADLTPGQSDYLSYLAYPEELFARSYSQYILKKAGDPRLDAQIEDVLNRGSLSRYSHWTDDDFAPIAAAFDELLIKLGWVK